VEKLAESFSRRALARTEPGRAFQANLAEYLRVTEDLERYSLEGFPHFKRLDDQLKQFLKEAQAAQADLSWQSQIWENKAKSKLDSLTVLAVITGLFVAAATTWEVQRRFRQLRRSLEAVRRERQFNAQMLEGMVSAIAAIDAEGRIRSVNAAFAGLFPQMGVGASVYELNIEPEEAARLIAAAISSPVTESVYRGRWMMPAELKAMEAGQEASGAERVTRAFDVYSSPLDIDGQHGGQILTLVDVTEAAESEREVRRTESLAAVGQAAAQVAHEIKNPLGSIRLGVAMLRDMTDSGEAHNTIDLVERGINHLNKLTIDVTQYSREKDLSLSHVNLNDLLDASLELVTDRLQRKRTPVEKRYSPRTLAGQLDADQLRQVFVNLIANAVDASAEGSPVTITIALADARRAAANGGSGGDGRPTGGTQDAPRARVTVTDSGAGMDEKTRARVFEPFFTTKKRGTGLGLAIVRKIIAQHGGAIWVESAPGKGTSFIVELPLSQG
ncbi:MAG: two-component system sensor histidine kinase NtrB, partial [Pyrinomonadaceae bacterium]